MTERTVTFDLEDVAKVCSLSCAGLVAGLDRSSTLPGRTGTVRIKPGFVPTTVPFEDDPTLGPVLDSDDDEDDLPPETERTPLIQPQPGGRPGGLTPCQPSFINSPFISSPHGPAVPGTMGTLSFIGSRKPTLSYLPSPHRKGWDILPSEVDSVDVDVRIDEQTSEVRVYAIVKYTRPLIGWILLLIATVAFSAGGPAFDTLPEDVRSVPLLVAAWRGWVFLVPFLVLSIVHAVSHGIPPPVRRALLSPRQALTMMLTGAFFGGYATLFVLCTNMGVFGVVVQFACMTPFVMVVGNVVAYMATRTGLTMSIFPRPHKLEIGGLCLGMVGATLALQGKWQPGTGVALGASAALGGYLVLGKVVRPWVPYVYLMLYIALGQALFTTFFAFVLEGAAPRFFEFTRGDVVGGLSVYAGANLVAQASINGIGKFDIGPLTVAVALATEPEVATAIDVMLGNTTLPPVMVCIAAVVLLAAAVCAAYGDMVRDKVRATDITPLLKMHLGGSAAAALGPTGHLTELSVQ